VTSILAVDIGSSFGWAWVVGGEVADFGSYTVKGKSRGERLVDFNAHVADIVPVSVDGVIYERPFCRGLHATRLLWGMAAIVEMQAHIAGKPCVDQVSTTIKKWFTGNGRADKTDMIWYANHSIAAIGRVASNDHEADAIALGLYAVKHARFGND
jgi:crossover junction endodeoxyribonuclease RuvC